MLNTYARKVVGDIKKKYKTTDPFELVDCLDITLIITSLGSISGMYKYINRNKTIFLNENLSEYEQRFVLAHEIGHAIMHTKSSCFFSNTLNNKLKIEYQANIFAAELLIDLKDIYELYLEGYSIKQLAAYYNVPVELIEFKFKENNKNIC